MGWTKRELIVQAFDEIGIDSAAYDLTPDQLNSAMRKMDAMVSSWSGVHIGYPIPNSANGGDIDADSGVPAYAVAAIYLNLAVALAPGYGKAVAPETKASAKVALNQLTTRTAFPVLEMRLPSDMPLGAGNRGSIGAGNRSVGDEPTEIDSAGDGEITFE